MTLGDLESRHHINKTNIMDKLTSLNKVCINLIKIQNNHISLPHIEVPTYTRYRYQSDIKTSAN